MESVGSSAANNCLDEETLLSLAEGRVDARRRNRAATHLDRCEDCRRIVVALAREPTVHASPPGPHRLLGELSDRFSVVRELGRGPHGVAVLARTRDGAQSMRLKRIDEALTKLPGAAARISAAVVASTGVDHFNIARVLGCHVSGGRLWIASAFAEGDNLSTSLDARAPSRESARDVVAQLVGGLAEAHRRGIVHGNLVAQNVIVDLAGQVRLTDFGLVPAPSATEGMRADVRAACQLAKLVLERGDVTTGALNAIVDHCLADANGFSTACELERAIAGASRKNEKDSACIPAPGELIAGKYRVVGLLGVGGMGVVVTATQLDLGRRVAIKLMPPRAARRSAAVERFMREARAASAIENDHVVRIFEVGKSDNGVPFMVMEHLDGVTLGALVARRGPLPAADAIDIVLQASIAVAECHARGIVHRDLKPDNVMVVDRPAARGFVKVLDFGVSKADWEEDGDFPRLTDTLDMLGTPTYMSPEQVRSSKSVDSRTDIWALGVMLYELLTGRPPFIAGSVPALSAMIVSDEPQPLAATRPDLAPGLEHVVRRCLEKRPERRPACVRELAELLLPYASAASLACVERIRAIAIADLPRISSLPPPPTSSPIAAPPPGAIDVDSEWRTTPLRPISRWLGVSVAAGAALIVVSAVVWALVSTGNAKPSAERTEAAPTPTLVSQPRTRALVEPETLPAATRNVEPDAGAPKRRPRSPRRQGPLDERF